jgi:diguanylate cyclase (GGDEF)-like protein
LSLESISQLKISCELDSSELSLQSIIDGYDDAVFICGFDSLIIGFNQSCRKLLADFACYEINSQSFLIDYIDTDNTQLFRSFALSRSQAGIIASRLTLKSKNNNVEKQFQGYFSLVKSAVTKQPAAVLLRLSEHESKLDFRFRDLQLRMKQTQRALKTQRILATIDPLTGLSNRRHFMALAKQALLMQKRLEVNVGVLMLDIDYFKKINDTYGHAAGDAVLIKISKIIKANCREIDLTCRWGGEEFVILSTNAIQEKIVTLAERLRCAIEDEGFFYQGKKIPITISLGLAQAQVDEECEQVIARADDALYKAKNSGRNRLIISQPEVQ